MKVEVVSEMSHTLFDPEKVVKLNKGQTPTTYQKFTSLISSLKVPKPVETLSNLPENCKIKDLQEKEFQVPKLSEFGLDETKLKPCKFPGGETEGLKRLEEKFANGSWVRSFEKPQTSPNSLEPSTTVLR